MTHNTLGFGYDSGNMSTSARKKYTTIQKRLLKWFDQHKRNLPWRATYQSGNQSGRNPYHVWLAEVMLQQTQVATVIPYFQRWLQRFPTLQALANAPLDDVLKQWEGLGYYSRARNFHKAAQQVVQELDGQIPCTVDGLLALPGVGRYTAGAIASLAFGQDAPILDGNVKRVLSRLFAFKETGDRRLEIEDLNLLSLVTNLKDPNQVLWVLSEQLLPKGKGRAGAFNEALMDLGATVCTPRAPDCKRCPLQTECSAYAQGAPEAYPIKPARKATPHKDLGVLVLFNAQGQVLMGQRPVNGLLGGLWEFVSGEIDDALRPLLGEDRAAATQRMAAQQAGLQRDQLEVSEADFVGTVKHAFTHYKITKHVFVVQLHALPKVKTNKSSYQQLDWIEPSDIQNLALTRSDQKILAMINSM
jgi:A/G-specific adenine glycosylase